MPLRTNAKKAGSQTLLNYAGKNTRVAPYNRILLFLLPLENVSGKIIASHGAILERDTLKPQAVPQAIITPKQFPVKKVNQKRCQAINILLSRLGDVSKRDTQLCEVSPSDASRNMP